MRCGVCGCGFSKISAVHFSCFTARNKGETVCGNRLTIRRDAFEATVMEGLRSRLMDPTLVQGLRGRVRRRIELPAVGSRGSLEPHPQRAGPRLPADRPPGRGPADGEPAQRLTEKLKELERRRLELERELETAAAPAPRLHPNIAEAYRRKVEELQGALKADDAGPARELIRGLVEAIGLVPESGRLRIEVLGDWPRF